ncbi:hypothetical protein M9H77_04792 [Catharanthus roseus]|uniref:Uncharacterized protein n=1 Tax=Catharanthus roseus TaxID=4058 RepID=A0ACC0CFJ4_CATRO|nr:hypothetical protein M9H77_04792 [Catharanthus roseus]
MRSNGYTKFLWAALRQTLKTRPNKGNTLNILQDPEHRRYGYRAMEEEKAAAYYDELTRKGEGAARFKQGLGFNSASSNDAPPSRGSALSSSSSFLSSFVKASSPSKAVEFQKEAQLASIQNKLKKKPNEAQSQSQSSHRVSRDRDRDDRHSSHRTKSRSRSRDRDSKRRSRSRSRDSGRRSRRRSRSRDRDRHSRRRSRSRSRSRSRDDYRRRRGHRSRSRERDRERGSRRRRSRSESPLRQKSEKSNTNNGSKVEKERNDKVDYEKQIQGYDKMTPAERTKAKMKLQLSETAEKDEANMGSGWERFDFDKDAPLDDEEIEAAEDDAVIVKHVGQSFRFSAVETRKKDELKAAHDEAMFGAPSLPPEEEDEDEEENTKKETNETAPAISLLSDQVLTMQQGSWRDRIRKG